MSSSLSGSNNRGLPEWAQGIEIWGFAGKMGSGKNYLAEEVLLPLLENHDGEGGRSGSVMVCAFADHLKIHCMGMYGLSYEVVFGPKTTQSRQCLQKEGSKMRKEKGINVWVDILESWIRLHSSRGIRRFIITDVRHVNEFEWVKRMGGKVIYVAALERTQDRLEREAGGDLIKMLEMSGHESEVEMGQVLGKGLFDLVVKNDYGQDGPGDIRDFLKGEG